MLELLKPSIFYWFIKVFPKLEIIDFFYNSELFNTDVIRFIELNPQLKSLKILICNQITPDFIAQIADFTPNLESLCYETENRLSNALLIHITNLRHLKNLLINAP